MKRLLAFLFLCVVSASAPAAVNLNNATAEQLEVLEGIGPVKARAIVDYRQRHGAFRSLEELLHVDGIGEATLAKIRKDLSLTGHLDRAPARKEEPKKK